MLRWFDVWVLATSEKLWKSSANLAREGDAKPLLPFLRSQNGFHPRVWSFRPVRVVAFWKHTQKKNIDLQGSLVKMQVLSWTQEDICWLIRNPTTTHVTAQVFFGDTSSSPLERLSDCCGWWLVFYDFWLDQPQATGHKNQTMFPHPELVFVGRSFLELNAGLQSSQQKKKRKKPWNLKKWHVLKISIPVLWVFSLESLSISPVGELAFPELFLWKPLFQSLATIRLPASVPGPFLNKSKSKTKSFNKIKSDLFIPLALEKITYHPKWWCTLPETKSSDLKNGPSGKEFKSSKHSFSGATF